MVLFNYSDGLIARELNDVSKNLTIVDLVQTPVSNLSDFVQRDDIFIISTFSEFLSNFMVKNPLIIYYDINDFILNISDYKFGLRLPFLGKKLVKKLHDKESLIFMDDTGIGNLNREFKFVVPHPKYLPIPLKEERINLYKTQERELNDGIRISYIGRSVNWKMYPLKKIIEDCFLTNERITINIVIDNKEELIKYINIDDYKKGKLTLNIWENLPPSQINPFLINNSDLNFGMGTTALHSAAIGIPTILIDYSYYPFPKEYSYSWLWDAQNYSLGRNIDKVSFSKGNTMKQLLSQIKDKKERTHLSDLAFLYVANNHADNKVLKQLIEYSQQARFRLRDAKWLYPYFFKVHSITKRITRVLLKKDSTPQ
ncbi:MAG TPA: hypothetical protein PLM81_00660 [Ginsengibacter sp.]|nr:hypothetical protein [Ginsengibacter sp.]HRP17767.1 hypothetical protein [Ginsengibacter sp.]HRP43156.1 hypothetical protein [Ginsengibacter sp.]